MRRFFSNFSSSTAGSDSSPSHPLYEQCRITDTRNKFRLLRIDKCFYGLTNDDALPRSFNCSFEVQRLDSAPPFVALSYEWGSLDSVGDVIMLGGRSWPVQHNLWDAFRHIWDYRRRSKEGTAEAVGHRTDGQRATFIWVDYFCIDQSNATERNHQVAMMSSIYSRADAVVVWLGKADAGSDDVIDAIRSSDSYNIHTTEIKPFNDYVDPLLALLNRTYWSRMWIIQEFLLAKRLVIFAGRKSFEHRQTPSQSRSMRWISSCLDSTSTNKMGVPGFRLLAETNRAEMRSVAVTQMAEFLEAWSEHLCKDPRDKIFALLGLTDQTEAWPKADYTMEPADIYSVVLKTYVRCCNRTASLSPERFRRVLFRSLFPDMTHINRMTVRQMDETFFRDMWLHGVDPNESPLDRLLQQLDRSVRVRAPQFGSPQYLLDNSMHEP